MSTRIEDEIKKARELVGKIEQLVFTKREFPNGDRNKALMAYWSLAFELHKAILSLIEQKLYGAAFALVRPLLECTIRGHLVIFVSDAIFNNILDDKYRTDFATVGKEIDQHFGLEGFFEKFLTGARLALHGYTHIGMHQLGRRFKGSGLAPNYSEDEIVEVIRTSTSAAFMVNNIVTKHFEWKEEWEQNTDLFVGGKA